MHSRPSQRITDFSDLLARIERRLMGVLIISIFGVVLLNLVFRSIGWALYWADETAIYLMIWAAMVGASISVKLRTGIAVRLLYEFLPPSGVRILDMAVDALVLVSALALLWFCWVWYDPALLAVSGFDRDAFRDASFNFIYHEPAVTLGIGKVWLWMIMPMVALSMTVHATANLVEAATGGLHRLSR